MLVANELLATFRQVASCSL